MKELRERIRKSGIKQTALAEKLGCSPISLSYWLNETQPMPDDKKKKILEILGRVEVAMT